MKQSRVQPTKEERANGWTEETLKAYIAEREVAQAEAIFPEHPPLIVRGLATYNAKKDF